MVEPIRTWQETLRDLSEQVRTPGPRRPWRVEGLKGGARPFFLFRFLAAHPRPSLIISAGAKDAERLAGDLRFFFDEAETRSPFARRIHYLPAWEVVPFEDLSPPADVVAARIEGLYHLRQSRDPILLTTPEALLQRVPPLQDFATRHLYLVEGDAIDRDRIAEQLDSWGYRRLGLVEDRGEFSVRGGIIDIFPPAHPKPIRVNLDGDLIETMHEFDPVTQRLRERQAELLILPVREFDLRAEQRRSVQRAVEARALDLEVGREERNLILEGLASGLLFPGV